MSDHKRNQWFMLVFSKDDGELVEELEIGSVELLVMQELFSVPADDDMNGAVYIVTEEQRACVEEICGLRLDLSKFAYHLNHYGY